MKLGWLLVVLAVGAAPEPSWNFAGGLHGTTAQIRQSLNAEVIRLTRDLRETQHNIKDAEASLEADHKACLARYHASDPGKRLDQQEAAAAKDLVEARTANDDAKRARAASQHLLLLQLIKKSEKNALAGNPRVTQDAAELKRYQEKAAAVQESLDAATAWRDKVIEAIRQRYRAPWPLSSREPGLLPDLKVRAKLNTGIIADYEAEEELSTGAIKEGIQDREVMPHRVTLLVPDVPGFDTVGVGDTITLDQCYVTADVKYLAGRSCTVMRREAGPVDDLMKAITSPITDQDLYPTTRP